MSLHYYLRFIFFKIINLLLSILGRETMQATLRPGHVPVDDQVPARDGARTRGGCRPGGCPGLRGLRKQGERVQVSGLFVLDLGQIHPRSKKTMDLDANQGFRGAARRNRVPRALLQSQLAAG